MLPVAFGHIALAQFRIGALGDRDGFIKQSPGVLVRAFIRRFDDGQGRGGKIFRAPVLIQRGATARTIMDDEMLAVEPTGKMRSQQFDDIMLGRKRRVPVAVLHLTKTQ